MGIEPTTLGLKGQVGLLYGVASLRKLSPTLDKSRREVAAFLRVSTRTVYALCDEGKLAHVRIANAIRVESAALAALVRSRTE